MFFLLLLSCVEPVAHQSWTRVFALQAEEARKYGARVYCVGIKDFDEQQVSELYCVCSVIRALAPDTLPC